MIAVVDPIVSAPPARGRSIVELIKTVSASRLNTWLSCRLKFYFRYVVELEKSKTPALHVGTVVHAVLQEWNKARWHNRAMDEEAVEKVFSKAWDEQEDIEWKEAEEEKRTNALDLIRTYFRDTPIPPNEKPMAVEVAVEMSLAHHGLPTLVGIIDLVRSGRQVVDFKTSAQTPNPATVLHFHELQTTGYAMLFREATGKKESAIELHSLVKLKTPKLVVSVAPPATEQQVNRFLKTVESYVQGVSREDFVPSPGMACMGCQFINECRKWS